MTNKSLYNQLVEALEISIVYAYEKREIHIEMKFKRLLTALKAHGEKVDVEGLREAINILQGGKTVTDIHTRDEIIPVDVEIINGAAKAHLEFMEGGE